MSTNNSSREGLFIGIGVSILMHLGLIAGLIILDYTNEQALKSRITQSDCSPSIMIIVPLQETTNTNTEMEI